MRVKTWITPVDDENAELCPQCDGSCFADQYEEEVCRTCLGTGEVPRLVV